MWKVVITLIRISLLVYSGGFINRDLIVVVRGDFIDLIVVVSADFINHNLIVVLSGDFIGHNLTAVVSDGFSH